MKHHMGLTQGLRLSQTMTLSPQMVMQMNLLVLPLLNFNAEIETLAEEAADDDELLLAQREALRGCMAALDTNERNLIEQRYAGDRTIAELAEANDKTPNSLYIVLHRVRAKLIACVDRKLAEGDWQ